MLGNNLPWLEKIKTEQRETFERLKFQFLSIFKLVSKYSVNRYLTPTWNDFNHKMENIFLPIPPFNFLSKSLMMYSMIMTKGGKLMAHQLDFIEKIFGRKIAKKVLKEDLVGCPIVIDKKYLSSPNRIHQLYHLAMYQSETGNLIANHRTFTEWGAGYGNMVVVIKRLINKPITYICVDTPLFTAIQWLYLSTIFGQDQVQVITEPGQKISHHKINLIPVSLISKISFSCDFFISNWALSESSQVSQKLVSKLKWFGAKHLLLGYQEKCDAFKGSEEIGIMVQKSGGFVEEIDILPSNYYGFK